MISLQIYSSNFNLPNPYSIALKRQFCSSIRVAKESYVKWLVHGPEKCLKSHKNHLFKKPETPYFSVVLLTLLIYC
jgi:hypothetical protein